MHQGAALFEVRDHVATLTLDEPERFNPLTPALQAACRAALRQVRADPTIRVLVLTGNGSAFCAGGDLQAFDRGQVHGDAPSGLSLGEQVGEMMRDTANPLILELRTLPVPVLCSVNGVAAGGGVGLALAADIVIAARSAYFYLPFVPSLGLVPDMGASWFLPRAVGRARALGMTLLGERISASAAAEAGLIWRCVDDGALSSCTADIAARLARLPAHAIGETRALFAASAVNDLSAQLDLERVRQCRLIDDPCFVEGLAASLARRTPVFPARAGGSSTAANDDGPDGAG